MYTCIWLPVMCSVVTFDENVVIDRSGAWMDEDSLNP